MTATECPTLVQLAERVRALYDRAAADDPDLWGGSLLDLVADNIREASMSDLKAAIIVSGIYSRVNERLQRQIATYRSGPEPEDEPDYDDSGPRTGR